MKSTSIQATQIDAENLATVLNHLEELIYFDEESETPEVPELQDDDFRSALEGVQQLQRRILLALRPELCDQKEARES